MNVMFGGYFRLYTAFRAYVRFSACSIVQSLCFSFPRCVIVILLLLVAIAAVQEHGLGMNVASENQTSSP